MIVTITPNPSFDRSVTVRSLAVGEVNKAISTRVDAGGKGVNVSKMIKNLGGNSVATGFAGNQNFAVFGALLDDMGIDHDFVLTDGRIRTNIKLSDDITGETTDINESGSPVTASSIVELRQKLGQYITKDTVTVISGSANPPELYGEILRFCNSVGCRVFVDTSGKSLEIACKEKSYCVKPNIFELCELTGKKLDSLESVKNAALDFVKSGIHTVCVSMGGDGLMLVTSENALFSHGLSVQVKCTVGAGDSVTASLAYAMSCGFSDEGALRLASATGTAAVQMSGSAAPSRDMIENLMSEIQIVKI